MRLACWPFEVEGQGDATSADVPTAEPAAPIDERKAPPAPRSASASSPAPGAARPPEPTLREPRPLLEEARYDIRYGILGSVGSLRFSAGGTTDAADGTFVVKIEGSGQGAVLGLGGIQRRIDAEFDPGALASRRWTILRRRDGQTESEGTVDTGKRGTGNILLLERAKSGEPPSRQTVAFTVPTSDPLGVLWRLRTAPPPAGHSETLQLLDGLALWRIRVTTAGRGELLPDVDVPAIRLDGEMSPIFYDGRADPERPARRFTLWLSASADHLPLRLEVPVGLADVVMTLTETRTVPPKTVEKVRFN
jgi:Protein of unknown function (DUF3108)